MKYLIALALTTASFTASAAPFLYADPYAATGVQPDTASLTVNGGAPIQCQLMTVTAGLQPKCDLGSITTVGTYTLVMTVAKAASITNTTGGATNTGGGTASSAPFSYVLRSGNVSAPVLRVAP